MSFGRATRSGATDGYKYIFRIDPIALANPKTWIFALGQAFFSLSVAGNGTLIYGSYLSDKEDIPASAARVAFFDTLAAMLAALVIIPAMATTGAQLNQGGPGLLFIYLPSLIKSMPGGNLICIIFSYRSNWSCCFNTYSGYCFRLDGCFIYLYLSTWSRTCRNNVLLGMWKEIC